jgi:predicted NodU family carbamoyl transferase
VPIKREEKKTTLTRRGESLAAARTERVVANRKRRILPLGSEATFSLREAESRSASISSVCKEVGTVYKRPMGPSYYQRRYPSFDQTNVPITKRAKRTQIK